MNFNKSTGTGKNSLSFASVSLAAIAVFVGLLISLIPSHRQYFPVGISVQQGDDDDKDAGSAGMVQFFFNARKNISTNKMDYSSMLAADIADRAMAKMRRTHSASAVPNFDWTSVGPTNVGGRTRAFLIDNKDPSHQTLFAGGVSGGIWKSTNGGGTWDNASAAICYSLNDTMSNINIGCIAQDANGVLYVGTGEGFMNFQQGEGYSTGMVGGGIFKSTDDGNTWQLLPSTQPASNSDNVTWAYVNRIAIRPDSPNVIYAATQGGLLVSHNGGVTWGSAINASNNKLLSGTKFDALDVKISTDGSVVMACIGAPALGGDPSTAVCYGYYCYPQSGPDSAFTQIKSTGYGHLLGNAARIEFAISPTDANRVYASVIQGNGEFGTGGTSSGIFMTMTSKTNGGYWYDIGPGGSFAFDPYSAQATYDNALGVPPANEAQVLVGGTTLYEWSGNSLTDSVGAWQSVSHYAPYYLGDPYWIHADEHTIVFDQTNSKTVYIGCDGGVFKCTDMYIDPNNAIKSIKALSFQPINRNYNVTQYYTICFAPDVYTASVPVSINNGNSTQQEMQYLGMGGGTQDNGSPYVNGTIDAGYPNDGVDLSGGDGAGCAVSQINPNIAYFCSDYGTFERTGNLSTVSNPDFLTTAYTKTIGDCKGGDIDSIANLAYQKGGASFVFPVALYENPYDLLNHDSLQFVAAKTYSKGDTIWPVSYNTITYPYILPKALAQGDTLTVPDRVVSRLAVGFSGSTGGIWINGQGASTGTVVWMPIGGADSKPTAFSDATPVHSLAWTADGNTLFAGCEDGGVYRFTNINSIIANDYCSGALWYSALSNRNIATGNTNIACIKLNTSGFSGRNILSISSDPNDTNNLLITVGNYGQSSYVFYSSNALAAAPTFKSVQGNLPDMPVYSSIMDILGQNGQYTNNSAMLATEHGIYTTSNITASSVQWVKNSGGLANVLTLAIKQQTIPAWACNNSGVIYAGTHGRGLWTSYTNFNPPNAVPTITTPVALNNLLVYPNPMTTEGNIQFNLATADNVTIVIYDMQGNEIKTINVGSQSPGNHLVTFESAGLRQGTYFASLTGSKFRKVSKFVVIR